MSSALVVGTRASRVSGCSEPPAVSRDAESAAGTRVVAGWPLLAPGVVTGEAAGVGVDSHGHVFVFHRCEGDAILGLEPETMRIVVPFGAGPFENAHGLAIGLDFLRGGG